MKKFYAFFVAAVSALAMSMGMSSCSDDKNDPTPDPEEAEVATSLFLGEEEIALNTHSEVSAEAFNAIAVNVMDAPQATTVTYALYEMVREEGEESTIWDVPSDAEAIVEGQMSINGIAYTELEEPVVLLVGHKYQMVIAVTNDHAPVVEPVACETYVINGATALTVNTSLFNGADEFALYPHSEVSLEVFNAIAVSPEDAPHATSVEYALYELTCEAGEESSSWVVAEGTEAIVEGEMNINGIAYAELEQPVVLLTGHKYQLAIVVNGGNPAAPQVIAEQNYVINGATPMTVNTSVFSNGVEYGLSAHSEASVETIEGIAVAPEDAPQATSVEYALYKLKPVAGAETTAWETEDLPIFEGHMNINGVAYTEIDKVTLPRGNKYLLSITINGGNPAAPQIIAEEDYIINGAAEVE